MNDTSKSKEQQTDCKCSEEIKTGWTEIQCCNICGKSVEPFWRVEQQKEEPWHDLYLEEHMKKLLAEQQLKMRDEEVGKLVNALSHLVNANQNEASWDYPAAFSNAMGALKPYTPPKD